VDGVGVRQPGDADDFRDRQVGLDRPHRSAVRALADLVGLVGLEAVQRQLVLLGEHRDGGDAELVGGAEDADGDLRPVGDKDLSDRQGQHLRRRKEALSLAGLCSCEKGLCGATEA